MSTKVCIRCEEEQPVENFYKRITNKDGLDKTCKKCYSEKRRVKRDPSPEITKTLETLETRMNKRLEGQSLQLRDLEARMEERLETQSLLLRGLHSKTESRMEKQLEDQSLLLQELLSRVERLTSSA